MKEKDCVKKNAQRATKGCQLKLSCTVFEINENKQENLTTKP